MAQKMNGISDVYFEKLNRLKTWSGIEQKEVYTEEDLKDWNRERDLGSPGEYPYTRGIFPNMYRGRMWSRREICGYTSAAETNKRIMFLVGQGESAINVIFDTPTQAAIDSDHPMAEGDVGVQGTPLDILADMEDLTGDIPLDEVSFMLSTGPFTSTFYIANLINKGYDISKIRGTDPNEFLGRAFCTFTPGSTAYEEHSPRICLDKIAYLLREMPKWYPININSYNIRENGVTAAQEMGFVIATARYYLKKMEEMGFTVDDLAPKMTFTCGVHIDFFEEVAKFRASRRLWARMLKEEFKAQNPKSLQFRYHVNTAGCSLERQQPLNNVIRVSYEAMAAVMGGAQSLQTASYDEAVCLPTEQSQMLALRTQQILAHETGVANVVDPLGGSYYVESLTDRMEEEIRAVVDAIEDRGGIIEALKSGYISAEVENSAFKYQNEVENKERIVVGLNQFTIDDEEDHEIDLHVIESPIVKEHIDRLVDHKDKRDKDKTARALERLHDITANTSDNIVPSIIEAINAGASLGEVSGTVRMAHGMPFDPMEMVEYPF
jgi:methylmalonyl-CoA mutase N-terminal domain/subunit